MKGTKNLSKKRAIPARNAKANHRKMMSLTISSAKGIYIVYMTVKCKIDCIRFENYFIG